MNCDGQVTVKLYRDRSRIFRLDVGEYGREVGEMISRVVLEDWNRLTTPPYYNLLQQQLFPVISSGLRK